MQRDLRDVPARQIVSAVADAAERWRDADFPPRVRATRAIVERLEYTEPVVDYALDRLFESITSDTLRATIEGELGSLDALDGFVRRDARPDVWYRGVAHAAIVSSDTTIGVAVPHLVFALCAKANVIVKDRSDALVARFATTLADERPEIARALVAESWSGDDTAANATAFAGAQTVVAFGGDAALRDIRSLLDTETLFVPFGHRTSLGLISREALAARHGASLDDLARAAARDALLYDGDGCLSLHALVVEADAESFDAFASAVARACDDVSIEFPPASPQLDPRTATFRAQALFRAAQGSWRVIGGAAAPYVFIAGASLDEPPPLVPRAFALYRVDELSAARTLGERFALPFEGVGYAPLPPDGGLDARTLAVARGLGAARICPLGRLQDPPLTGNHGGAGRILPFVRAVYRES